MTEETVDVSPEDAAFITALSQFLEPQYLGDYRPLYSNSDSMSGLKFDESSPISSFDVKCGFTLHHEFITGLLITIKEDQQGIFDVISEKLPGLTRLKELTIVLENFPAMPDLQELSQLEYLSIYNNSDETLVLPRSISFLESLVVLKVRGPVAYFPNDLNSIITLQRIIMKNVGDSVFPNLEGLDKLVWLEIGENFTTIHDSLTQLQNLTILDIVANDLVSLPESIGNLQRLKHLSIESQSLASLPQSFGELQLTDLYLWSLNFETLPPVICKIESLTHLWYKDNSRMVGTLRTVPDCIGNLSELIDLQINGHQIEELPTTIGSLEKLETLNLGINALKSLPTTLFDIRTLKRLELYYNKLTSLPDEFLKISNLEFLDLSDNQLTTLPDSIGGLPILDELDLMGNPLEQFPDGFRRLHPFQFSTFMITLKTPPESLDQETQEWLEKMVKYSERHPERMVLEISMYEDENQADDK